MWRCISPAQGLLRSLYLGLLQTKGCVSVWGSAPVTLCTQYQTLRIWTEGAMWALYLTILPWTLFPKCFFFLSVIVICGNPGGENVPLAVFHCCPFLGKLSDSPYAHVMLLLEILFLSSVSKIAVFWEFVLCLSKIKNPILCKSNLILFKRCLWKDTSESSYYFRTRNSFLCLLKWRNVLRVSVWAEDTMRILFVGNQDFWNFF